MQRRAALIALSLLFVLTPLFDASAATIAPREFSPVQNGYVTSAPSVLPYAPGRIMVQFKGDVLDNPRMMLGAARGTEVPEARTGILSIDALGKDVGATRISRPYMQPKNTMLASRLGVDRWFMIELPDDADIPAIAARYAADPNVERATPDWRAFPAAVPSDPLYADHWGHNNTAQLPALEWGTTYEHTGDPVGTVGFDANAQGAWDGSQGYGSPSVIIAIVDSGVDIDHPDLNLVAGYDFGDNDSNPDDNSAAPGHGTCCAGVAASIANNGIGACGAAPGCGIMPCKIANSAGSMYFSAIENALYWAADNGADVISMSIGAPVDPGYSPATDAAIEYAAAAGCVILAATSNDNDNAISYPANHADVVGVGAASPCGDRKRSSSSSTECNPGVYPDPNGYTCDGERWWGSNYGSTTKDAADAVDVIAPTILPTTDIGGSGGYTSGDYDPFFNGTSCATPYAAGVCALIKSANPTWTGTDIRDQLCNTAIDIVNVESVSGWDRYSGYGMVDAEAAVGGGGPVAPVAEFAGSPTSGEMPLTVVFTDLSSGAPTGWDWDFGDGGSSTAQNPSHEYTAAGAYTVTLTATNAAGSDDEVKVDYITVTAPAPPVAQFSGTPVSGEVPLTVAFTDESTGNPASWSWDFGDGNGSTAQNPAHEYAAAGTYTVSMTATSPYGSDTETKIDYIDVSEQGVAQKVYALSDIPVAGQVSGDFSDTHASDDVRETITEVAYGGHPVKTYSYLEHRWDFNVPAGTSVTFFVEAARPASSDGDDFVFACSTDGALWTDLVTVASATEQVYSAALPVSTSGSVTIRVRDTARSWGGTANDAIAIDQLYIEVETTPGPPVAEFAGTPTTGAEPLTVDFTDLSTGSPDSWSWDFGDGNGSTAQNPTHEYASAGTYTVALTATNAYGSDTETKGDYVTVLEPGLTMHVNDIAVGRITKNAFVTGEAWVTVVDAGGSPIGGATVSGAFNAIKTSTMTAVTGSDGVAYFTTGKAKTTVSDFCFEVTGVDHASYTYDPAANAETHVCESGTVYSADGRGMLAADDTPSSFFMSQNFPNPFNPVTTIRFGLPNAADVRLEIFDVTGRRVATLVDGPMGAGTHNIEWNARRAASGIYLYRITAGIFSQTNKMILLR